MSKVHLLVYLLDEITSFVLAVLLILLLYVFVSCASCFLSMCCGFFFFSSCGARKIKKARELLLCKHEKKEDGNSFEQTWFCGVKEK